MSVRTTVLSIATAALLSVGLTTVSDPAALAAGPGSTCGAEDIVPGNPNAPILNPDTFQVISGEQDFLPSPELNDNASDNVGGGVTVCGYEQVPAEDGQITMDAKHVSYMLVDVAKGAMHDFSTTYYAEDDEGNVGQGTLTFQVTYVPMPTLHRVAHSKKKFTLTNNSPATLVVTYGPPFNHKTSIKQQRKLLKHVTVAPHDKVKLRSSTRVVAFSVSGHYGDAGGYIGDGRFSLYKKPRSR